MSSERLYLLVGRAGIEPATRGLRVLLERFRLFLTVPFSSQNQGLFSVSLPFVSAFAS